MKGPELTYTVTLDADDYATLMRLAMRYGTGAGEEGISTAVTFRQAIANPTIATKPAPVDRAS